MSLPVIISYGAAVAQQRPGKRSVEAGGLLTDQSGKDQKRRPGGGIRPAAPYFEERDMATETVDVSINRLEVVESVIHVRGTMPLIMNRFDEKAREEIAAAQGGKARRKKAPKDPPALYEAAKYLLDDGRDAVPSDWFKKACVASGRYVDGLTMTYLKGAFFTGGVYSKRHDRQLIPLAYEEVSMRQDWVRLIRKGTDLRYRPQYLGWSVEVPVRMFPRLLTPEQVINLFVVAGICNGVGEWRPERGGEYGTWEVVE